jgi:hypothetical protein
MSKKALLSVIIITALALLPVACKKGESGKLALGSISDIRELVVKDAAGYVVMNFKSMSEKGLFDEFLKDQKSLKEFNDFKKKTGLDPKKDLETGIVVLMDLPSGPDAKNENLYLVVSGKFDQNKIIAAMKADEKDNFKTETISGYTLYHGLTLDNETQQQKDLFLSFKNKDLILFASNKDSILAACQIADGKKDSIAKGSNLYDMFENVNQSHMFWGLFTIPESSKKEIEKGPGMMFPAFKDISSIYFGGSYDGKTLAIDANLFTVKSDTIKELATTLNSFKDMAKSFASQGGEQSAETAKTMEMIDKINISQEKDSVKITISLTKEQLESFKPKTTETGVK